MTDFDPSPSNPFDPFDPFDPACINPGNSKSDDSEITKLAIMGEQHMYMVRRIKSLHKLLLDLNPEIARISTGAGINVRLMVRILEDTSLAFMTDARQAIKKQSALVQIEVDARNAKTESKETGPGLEADNVPHHIPLCKLCGLPWTDNHMNLYHPNNDRP